jgi:hypothetical protein
MTAPDRIKKFAAAGLRYVQFGLVNAGGAFIGTGLPAQGASVGAYNARGMKGFQMDVPDPTTLDVVARSGADKWSFMFAPEGNPTGTATADMVDMVLRELMTNAKVVDIGDHIVAQGFATDQDGSEPQVCAVVSEYASSGDDDDFGNDFWFHEVVMLGKFSSKPTSMATGAQASETTYNFVTNQAAKTFWGAAFSAATWGFSQAAVLYLASEHMISVDAYVCDNGATEEFTLSYLPAGDETDGVVLLFKASDGSEITPTDVDAATGVVQFPQQDADTLVVCLYEVADGQIA